MTNQMWLVAKNTYLKRLKSFSFWALVIGPLLVPIIAIGISYLNSNIHTANLAVVNQTTIAQYFEHDKQIDAKISQVDSKNTAQQKLNGGSIDGYLIEDNGKFTLHVTSRSAGHLNQASIQAALSQYQIKTKAAKLHLTNEQLTGLLSPAVLNLETQASNGQHINASQFGANKVSATFTVIVIFIFLTLYTGVISQEIANEKSNRIMEILLAVTSSQVQYYGKIFGVMLLALTHIGIYVIGGTVLYFGFKENDIVTQATNMLSGLNTSFLVYIALMTFVAVAGFLVLASIIASLINDQSQAQQATQPVVYLAMIGYIASFALSGNPSNIVLQVMSFIPFISPTMMPTRFANQTVGASEAWIAFGLQVLAVVLITYFGEKVYARNVLSYSEGNLIKQLFRNMSGKDSVKNKEESTGTGYRSINQRLGMKNRIIIAAIIIILVIIYRTFFR
jgi:ABC-2 type transport system permease protein